MYFYDLAILIGIYSIVSMGANLVTGYGGVVTISQAAFFGIGAYILALLTTSGNFSFLFSTVIGILCCISLSMFVGMLSLRLGHDYFVIATNRYTISCLVIDE